MSGTLTLSRAQQLNEVGAQLFGGGQLEPARLHFLAALALEPENPHALQNLGATLRSLQHYAAAEVIARKSVAVAPDNVYARQNLAVSLFNLRKFDEALAILRDCVKDMPDQAPLWQNFGLVHYMTGNFKEALTAFDRSLALNPKDAQCQSDRALTLLALGRLQEGIEAYEVRWKILNQNKIWSLGIQEWKGEDIRGVSILVHHEQGFGDSIMLVRFLKQLNNLGAIITLAVPDELLDLFADSFSYVQVISLETAEAIENTAEFAYHVPLLNVMQYVGVRKPHDIEAAPYLKAVANPPMRLPQGNFKIGLVWASGRHRPEIEERRRVIDLRLFLPLLELRSLALISLQKGPEQDEIVRHGLEGLIFDMSPKLDDFRATAETIMCLDLVISVDSAVAHLAGALGKPCLMLSPYSRCWRWWGQDSGWPWYDRMFVYSQSEDGSWNKAVHNVVRAVKRDVKTIEAMMAQAAAD